MHVPDGFLDAPTSIATGAIAAGALGISLRRAERELRASGPALAGLTAPGRSAGAAVAVTLLVAGVVSLYASASPDGLQDVAGRLGFDGAAKGSSGPLAGYAVRGIGDGHLSGAVAGIVGVLVTIAAGLLIAKLSSLRSRSRAADPGT